MAGLKLASRLDPGCRLLCLALLSSATFFLGAIAASSLACLLAGLVIAEGIRPSRLLRESSYILFLAAFSLGLQCLGWEGGLRFRAEYLPEVARYGARLMAAFMAGRLFYASTSGSDLRVAAVKAGRLLPGRLKGDVALALVLTLGFIPIIREEWSATSLAAQARGMARGRGFGAGMEFLAAFLRRVMIYSTKLPEALASRGWELEGRASELRTEAWRMRDWLAAAAALLGLAAAALFRI
jgi:energy-coupling factor transport system permease protein